MSVLRMYAFSKGYSEDIKKCLKWLKSTDFF